MPLSRRAFLGVKTPGRGTPFRPPWAVAEALFQARCTRCSACIDHCPTHLLVKGQADYPEADFSAGRAPEGCTFCGQCRQACPSGALSQESGASAWPYIAEIGDNCLATRNVVCYSCRESCTSDAIQFQFNEFGIPQPRMQAGECNACAVCLADCPSQAIRIVRPPVHSSALRGAA